jgi:predicted metal-dependent hydrolase
VWKKTLEEEKDLIQGIILVAAALVHYQKNENDICLSILKRATEKIGNASGKYYNIDIDVLRNKVQEIISSGMISTFMI